MTDPTPLDLDAIEKKAQIVVGVWGHKSAGMWAGHVLALIEQVRKLTQENEQEADDGRDHKLEAEKARALTESRMRGRLAQAEQRVKDLLEENIELHESRVRADAYRKVAQQYRNMKRLGISGIPSQLDLDDADAEFDALEKNP